MPSVKPWFEEWFNHPLYLDVYSHRDDADARRLIAAVLPFLNIPAGSPVLDLACGTGRHAVVLAESGLQVTGVDLSENLLAIAGKETARLGHSIDLIRSDMRYLNLKKTFSAVFSLFTSFGYFDDDSENFSVFRVISDHLEPGGWFVFDYLNDPFIRQHLVPSDERRLEGARLIQNRRIEGRVLIKQVTIEKPGQEPLHFNEKVHLYTADELVPVLWAMGLTEMHRLGTLDGDPWTPESPRLILICKKS